MPTKYLDEEGLSHVVRRAKETFAEKKELWNWQKTEKGGAVAFEPVPDSVLEPVVEFKFKETLPAEGEKGPSNPSTIEGVSSINVGRCGKNLLPINVASPYNYYGITMQFDSNGCLVLNGTYTGDVQRYWNIVDGSSLFQQFSPCSARLDANKQYVLSAKLISGTMSSKGLVILIGDNTSQIACGTGINSWNTNEIHLAIIPAGTYERFTLRLNLNQGSSYDNCVIQIQLEEGNTATEFEAPTLPSESKHVVSFGDTYYGGSVNLATGVMTVTHLGFAFDGTEEWRTIGNVGAESDTFRHDLINSSFPELRRHVGWPTCSHFLTETNTGSLRAYLSGVFQETTWFFVVVDTNAVYSTNEAWKAFLATQYSNGTPVTIAYQLETPFEVQLDPIQIKSLASDKYVPQLNTVYTDQKSIQVGYQKFADIDGAVHTTGDETIDGIKTFKNTTSTSNGVAYTSLYVRNPEVQRGVSPEHSSYTNLIFLDSNGEAENTKNGRLGMVETVSPQEDSNEQTRLICYKYSNEPADSKRFASLNVGYDTNRIPYATAPATSDERTEASDIATRGWVNSKIESRVWNWLKTEKTKIASFEPVADSGIQPIIHFKFTETPPTEGDKSASNPSTIAGVEGTSVVCCGKNLFNYDCSSADVADGATVESGGITVSNNKGTYSFSGSNTSGETKYFYLVNRQNNELLLPPGTYTLAGNFKNIGNLDIRVQLIAYRNGVSILDTHSSTSSRTFEIPDGEQATILLYFRIANGIEIPENVTAAPQIEVGNQSTDFESYVGNTYQYSFGSTFYGGYVNLATGVMTVTHDTVELNENTYLSGMIFEELDEVYNVGFYPNPARKMILDTAEEAACTNFDIAVGSGAKHYQCVYLANNAMGIRLQLLKSELNLGDSADPADVRTAVHAWLGEHPGFLVYPVAEPYEVRLSPMQIKSLQSNDIYSPVRNYLYSNLNEVEVGYQRVANDSNVVHRTGNEVIEGVKTFANSTPGSTAGDSVTDLTIRNPAITRGVREAGVNWTRMIFADKDGDTEGNFAGRLGIFEIRSPKTNEYNNNGGEQFRFKCYKYSSNPSDYSTATDIILGYDKDGIAYATAPSTSIDRSVDTDIVTRDWLPKDTRIPQKSDLWNWQKTEKANAVTFNPASESILEPVVDFMFKEIPPAEGEKGPDNPSTIAGISEIKLYRTNKNILTASSFRGTATIKSVTWINNGDGSVTITRNATDTGTSFYDIKARYDALEYFPAGTYTFSRGGSASNVRFGLSTANTPVVEINGNEITKTFTLETGMFLHFYAYLYQNDAASNVVIRPQLELSSTATSIETGVSNTYTIQLGNTYYGGSVDLTTGIMTVTHYGYVFTGQEDFTYQSFGTLGRWNCVSAANGLHGTTDSTCTHYPFGVVSGCIGITGSGVTEIYFVGKSGGESPATFLAEQYAAGTPITFVTKLPLEEQFTVQLTSQQILSLTNNDKYSPRINTVYTDAASVHVGYQRYVDEDNFVDKESIIPDEEIDEAFAE